MDGKEAKERAMNEGGPSRLHFRFQEKVVVGESFQRV